MDDPRLHIIAVTGIVVRDDRFLIMKRSEKEKAYPGYWTVPGGKIVRHEYDKTPMTPNSEGWYDIVANTLKREIAEEANIQIDDVKYLTDMTFIRPDDIPVLVLSYWCRHKSGEVRLGKDMTDYAWVTPEEAKKYNLIPGIFDEIESVNELLKI
ncbi:MAG: NUDIX domain-containing protein [bacterium]|nr:NUDIX domain-containing protein [bacterium]